MAFEDLERSARKAAKIRGIELTERDIPQGRDDVSYRAMKKLHDDLWAAVYRDKIPKCKVEKIHDDGDVTLQCGAKKFVVTTEGEVFEQKQLTLKDLGKCGPCQEPTPESFGYFGGGRKNGKASWPRK